MLVTRLEEVREGLQRAKEPEYIQCGLKQIDENIHGLPCGAITEIYGSASSGRTSLLYTFLAAVTGRGEAAVVVDACDTLDVAGCGADLERLVWIRCSGHAPNALKAADLLIQGGGFRLVVLDLADVPLRTLSRIPLAYWFRFRRAVENTPTAMVVLAREPQVKQCASLVVEMKRGRVEWSGSPHGFLLLKGARLEAAPRKPARPVVASFEALAG